MAIIINTGIESNSIDNKSFALLRTNPKLTSNVKLVVDSSSNIFLSSFRANKELSKVEYQKYPIDPKGELSIDISKYYKKLPTSARYQVLRKYSDIAIYSDYEFQYEDQYQCGASFNSTKLYDEQYKIFAPIYLDKKIPSNFIVYRISSVDYEKSHTENTLGQNERILELLQNATIVKSFDLSISSNIGKYLNNHVNHKQFYKSALTINFKEGEKSSYNGIDIVNGGFVKKHEILEDYYTSTDYPEIFNNEIITGGFERNGVVPSNIINLEFLFDDDRAEDYKIFRYFGLYVDSYDEGSFKPNYINSNGEITIDPISYKSFYDLSGTTLVDLDMLPNASDLSMPSLNYVKDKEGNFYHVSNHHSASIPIEDNKIKVSIDGSSKGFFEGYSKTGNTIEAVSKSNEFKGFIKLTIIESPENNDKLFLCDKFELEIEEYNLGNFIMIADNSLTKGTYSGNRFSTNGNFNQIANAINGAISMIGAGQYASYVEGNSIIIEEYSFGNRKRQTAFGIYTNNISNFIQINSAENNDIGLIDTIVPLQTSTLFSEWNIYTMIGGSDVDQAIVVKKQDIGLLQIGEFISQLDSANFIKIIEIELDPFNIDTYRIILESPTVFSKDNVFEVYREYDVTHGKFSAYDFKDFDFDFYSTDNSKLGELEYEAGEYLPSEFFTGLTPILEIDNIDDTKVLEKIYSEYDRLHENQLKETSLKSRVVPVINKFSLVDGTNARSLNYILNANEAFGSDNLSPNIKIASNRNPDYLNMEHFHINKIPTDYRSDANKLRSLKSYLDFNNSGGISKEGLMSTSFDYFKSFFKWSGSVGTNSLEWISDETKKLYTIFNSGGSIESDNSTVFRGLRYIYKKRKETSLQSPTDFIMTSDIVDYRFGVVLNYTHDSTENSAPITVIKNDVFKFICVYIDLNTNDNSITEINRMSAYVLNDLKDSISGDVKNIAIPFKIDFGASIPGNIDDVWILNASEFETNPDFLKYVTPNTDGRYSSISFTHAGEVYWCDVVGVIDSLRVSIKGWPYLINNGTISGDRLNPSEFPLISTLLQVSQFEYVYGGSNVFYDLLESISAYEFSERFNKFNGVSYITIDLNGNEVLNEFVLSIEDGVDFYKPSLVKSASDPEKPKAYQLSSGEVGRIIVDRTDGGYLTEMRRMNGDYNPIFKDVITFSDIYSENKLLRTNASNEVLNNARELLIYNKFNDLGISFSSYKNAKEDYGYIQNYFYHKVNDENTKNILKLSQTSDKLPLYPVVGEIAIDKKNINLFKSKYSSDYFSKATVGGKSELVYGTLSPVEKINFMNSTIMKVKNTYDLLSFSSIEETSINRLDDIRSNLLDTNSIHWYEDENSVVADFYLPRSIIQSLISDGIKNSFSNYVNAANSFGDKESIDDDLKLYINSNIVNRFIIDTIQIYGIESKNIATEFIPVNSISSLREDGYRALSNYTIKSYQNDSLSFRLIYNKRPGYSYKFKIHIKIQA